MSGCSKTSKTVNSKDRLNSQSHLEPKIEGTIKSFQSGNPSYVVLNNVKVIQNNKVRHFSKKRIKLPKGNFNSPNFWISDNGKLTLSIGNKIIQYTDTGQIINTSIHWVKPKEKVLKGIGGPGSTAQH
jgi:hypothetical protein